MEVPCQHELGGPGAQEVPGGPCWAALGRRSWGLGGSWPALAKRSQGQGGSWPALLATRRSRGQEGLSRALASTCN